MPLTPAEEQALQALLGLGLPEELIRAHLLKLRDQGLEADKEALLAALDQMHPQLAARALHTLADRAVELADDYEEELERKRRERNEKG